MYNKLENLMSFLKANGIRGLAGKNDLNRDKAPDLVTINSNKTISIFLNTGTDFSLSASNPAPTTVSTASSVITVTLLNAFDNPVALACTVQPATSTAPTCVVNPDSVTPARNASQTAELDH